MRETVVWMESEYAGVTAAEELGLQEMTFDPNVGQQSPVVVPRFHASQQSDSMAFDVLMLERRRLRAEALNRGIGLDRLWGIDPDQADGLS
jgi:hypothetical protein